jgi:hypothetical protein
MIDTAQHAQRNKRRVQTPLLIDSGSETLVDGLSSARQIKKKLKMMAQDVRRNIRAWRGADGGGREEVVKEEVERRRGYGRQNDARQVDQVLESNR